MLKEIQDVSMDLHDIRSRIAQYKMDADRACNIRDMFDDTEDYIESLLNALVDAKEAFDDINVDLLLAEEYLDKVIDTVEYNEVAAMATS